MINAWERYPNGLVLASNAVCRAKSNFRLPEPWIMLPMHSLIEVKFEGTKGWHWRAE
jgi:hypothetical protein